MMVDGREGLTAADEFIATTLRRHDKPIVLAVNKIDGVDPAGATTEFYGLGLKELHPIAAAHGRGIGGLMKALLSALPEAYLEAKDELEEEQDSSSIRIAFMGRPNAGKSTLINRLIGEERLLTYNDPGTTRDSIEVPFEKHGQEYTLIDTAGVRRRSRVTDTVEKFSAIKSLRAMEACHVVIMVLDARQGIAEQDASLIGLVLESGRAMVLALNKWDGLTEGDKERVRRELSVRLQFLDFVERHPVSALHGSGVGRLLAAVKRAYASAMAKPSTAVLTRVLEKAVSSHQPPLVRGRRVKLRYAHQGGQNPPRVVIHGNQTQHVPATYRRYLMNYFREALNLTGTPIRVEFKTGENPYAGRRNKLTLRQQHHRKHLIRRVKRGS